MLFLIVSLAASTATHSVVRIPEPAAALDRCHTEITYAKTAPPAHVLRRLGEEPPANEYLAVVRMAGGCPTPAVVQTGIGR
jgi:hypothetical protein